VVQEDRVGEFVADQPFHAPVVCVLDLRCDRDDVALGLRALARATGAAFDGLSGFLRVRGAVGVGSRTGATSMLPSAGVDGKANAKAGTHLLCMSKERVERGFRVRHRNGTHDRLYHALTVV
jgi:hypothetical protein